jgi:serine/threonine protein phosphatase 1
VEGNIMIYITSDIHGDFSRFSQLLEDIKFSSNDKMYILGDVIYRVDKSFKLMKYIMDTPNIYMLLGNHEKLFLEIMDMIDNEYVLNIIKNVLDNKIDIEDGIKSICLLNKDLIEQCNIIQLHHWRWLLKSTGEGYSLLKDFLSFNVKEREDIKKFMLQLPLYYIEGDYLLVHSGIDASVEYNTLEELLQKQTIYDFILARDKFIYNPAIKDKIGKIVVFGDTPTMNIEGNENKGKIWYDKKHNYDKIGVDCGCGFEDGYLGCLRLDDMKEFYVY